MDASTRPITKNSHGGRYACRLQHFEPAREKKEL